MTEALIIDRVRSPGPECSEHDTRPQERQLKISCIFEGTQ
jgi:hypothetical protein